MSQAPVILLNFANQLDAYLPALDKESESINSALRRLHNEKRIELYREAKATTKSVFDDLQTYPNRVALFHYGGHADGERLYFEDQAGNALGVAALLGQQKNLQLVFLNGCATLPQVEELFKQGVPLVIATAVAIDDQRAVQFAEKFYQSLAAGSNIRSAFQSAVAFMQMIFGAEFAATICKRGAYPQFENSQYMPWGLFVNDTPQAETALLWHLPHQVAPTVSRPDDGAIPYRVNSYIVGVIDTMANLDKTIEQAAYDSNGEPKDERELMGLIIENLPWPIGVQVRLLATKDDQLDTPSIERLKQLVSTYVVGQQFLYYTLLSQIWDVKRKQRPAGAFQRHSQINFLSEGDFNFFDYSLFLIDAARELEGLGVPFFLKEMSEFVAELQTLNSELQIASQHLQALRLRLNAADISQLSANIFQACADAEYALAVFLDEIAFLVNYDLITIRDIHVLNFRYTTPQYNHFLARLNAKVTDLTVGRTPRPRAFAELANNASVILTPDINDVSKFLNLSPFIIDKNAFGVGLTEDKATEQQLYMYGYRQQDDYKYFSTQHNIFRAQERTTDQLLTNEGEINANATESSSVRNRFLNRTRRPAAAQAGNEDAPPPSPFATLRQQFTIFAQDLAG